MPSLHHPVRGSPGASNLEAMEAAANYHRFLVSSLLARVDPTRPILDFGAGSGRHARALRQRGLDVSCVETDPVLRRRLRQEGFQASAGVHEYETKAFGSVYSLNVLEHIEDDAGILRDLFTVTASGGRLILYVPAFPVLFSAMDRRVGHVRRYRRAQFTSLVERAGFRVISCLYIDSLGFVISLVYRWLATTGALSPWSVAGYDRVVFPMSRALDRVTTRWFGKNILLTAHRD